MDLEQLVTQASHFSSHSKEISANGIFVALKGETVDGHAFVADVLKRGVLAVIVERDVGINDPKIIRVESTERAHWQIAALMRKKFLKPVVGVGGSNGKTSTKDFLFQILSKKFKCIRTEKSQNGKLGLPKTLEKLRPDVEVAVIEIGTDAPGDMQENVALVQPTIAALTSIGEEHLNLLGDLEGVFREERVLADFVFAQKKGQVFCPKNDPYLQRLRAQGALLTPARPSEVNHAYKTPAYSPHTLQNLALAVSVAQELGVTHEMIGEALREIALPDGRGGAWQVRSDLTVLRDHYNANPSSVRAALAFAQSAARESGRALRIILGDMLDLGAESEAQHEKILSEVFALGPACCLIIGPQFEKAGKSTQLKNAGSKIIYLESSAAPVGEDLVREFQNPGVVLAKGSRGTQVERVMDKIFGIYDAKGA